MKANWLLVLLLAVASIAQADDIAVLLPDTPKSYIVTVDAQGVASIVPLKSITRPGPAPVPPTPTPPVPPPVTPPVLTERGKAFQSLALKATADPFRAETARGLAEIYRQIAKLIDNGTIKSTADLSKAQTSATDTFMVTRDIAAPQAWLPVRQQLSFEETKLLAPVPAPLSAFATLLREAADGLDASAMGIAINPDTLKFILEVILPLILSLFKK